jgi:16S rRNA (uracil1498-N3)-methyltransferase
MSSSERHVFRFFVDASGESGATLQLSDVDRRHAEVLRLMSGDRIELVDGDGVVWSAAWRTDGMVELIDALPAGPELVTIELYACALTGNRFDELVDGAVQAGAAAITPIATNTRDAERLAARLDRLQRVAAAAARQAKRAIVPRIESPIAFDAVPLGSGIIIDPSATDPLDDVVRSHVDADDSPLCLLVGAADGLDPALVERLVGSGWRRARLGPTILRSELAAPVAVAIAAMMAASSRRPTR